MSTNEHKLTPEARELLLGFAPMDNDTSHTFTPPALMVVPEEFRPTFSVRQFDKEGVDTFRKIMKDDAGQKNKTSEQLRAIDERYYTLTHKYFDTWSNLYNLTTNEVVEYDGDYSTFRSLKPATLNEILKEIVAITGLTPAGLMR